MKKILTRLLCLALASTMLFGATACGGDETNTDESGNPATSAPSGDQPDVGELVLTPTQHTENFETTTEEYAFITDNISKGVFSVSGLKIGRGKANSAQFLEETLGELRFTRAFSEESIAEYEGDLKCQVPATTIWDTLYIGLRNTGSIADVDKSIWITIRENQIGMRIGGWDNGAGTRYVPCSVNFMDFRHFRIVDNPMKNEIEFYVHDDSGKEILLANIVIEEGDSTSTATLYVDGKEALQNTTRIPRTGQFVLWTHNVKDAIQVKNLTVKGSSSVYKGGTKADDLFIRDVFADTWVATDDEGRFVTTDTANGVNGNEVGMFYFMWHNGTGNTLYNHSKAYYEGGVAGLENVMKQGAKGFAHYWAEPYFGYYNSTDEWVIRKHMYMLNDAGVDFIFFDVTNGLIYEETLLTILSVMEKMRVEGYDTPQVAFHCGDSFVGQTLSTRTIPLLWTLLYGVGRYDDLWYRYDGKPLIFAGPDAVEDFSSEIKSFFTFRRSWADSRQSWYTDTDGKGCWAWGDVFQKPGLSPDGEVEQMVVMSGFWANGTAGATAGRSFSNGRQPASTDYSFSLTNDGTSGKGIAYQEHFNNAINEDPSVIMIVGWNEWWAGRWESYGAAGSSTNTDGMSVADSYKVSQSDSLRKNYYVDAFSPEFSRDIEPVNGIYKDNYYYQTALNIRNYKGTRALAGAFGQKDIDMSAGASQWYAVGPEYRDYEGDIAHRDAYAYVTDAHYVNTTGRNDFVTAKVSVSGDNVYFMAECANDITAAEGTNWMNLFIDSDCNASTGWYGYDYVINRSQNGNKASVEALATTEKNAEWSLSSAGDAEFTVSGNMIVIKVAKSTIKVGDTFDFKWADNSVADGKEIMQFLDLGDAAPNGRYNYRYTTANETVAAPSCLESSMVVFKTNSYNAYVNGAQVMINAENTNITALGQQGTVYLPKTFVEGTLGYAAGAFANAGTYCGEMYVSVTADAVAAQGKVLTVAENGLIVIADKEITDAATIRALYRSLM